MNLKNLAAASLLAISLGACDQNAQSLDATQSVQEEVSSFAKNWFETNVRVYFEDISKSNDIVSTPGDVILILHVQTPTGIMSLPNCEILDTIDTVRVNLGRYGFQITSQIEEIEVNSNSIFVARRRYLLEINPEQFTNAFGVNINFANSTSIPFATAVFEVDSDGKELLRDFYSLSHGLLETSAYQDSIIFQTPLQFLESEVETQVINLEKLCLEQ